MYDLQSKQNKNCVRKFKFFRVFDLQYLEVEIENVFELRLMRKGCLFEHYPARRTKM